MRLAVCIKVVEWGSFRGESMKISHYAIVEPYPHFAKHATAMSEKKSLSMPIGAQLNDQRGRRLRDLRISVTDRGNFRCSYCMPKQHFGRDCAFLPQTALLSFKEISRVARQFVALGVQKIRLTGGEPLDLTLTTNGALMACKAQALKDAGLQRLTVSLDGLDDAVFRRMNDVDFPVDEVLARLQAQLPQVPLQASAPGETATRWGYANAQGLYDPTLGEIGLISSVTQAFYHDCNRARLSTEGKVYTCLFADHGHDLRALLRANVPVSDAELQQAIASIWQGRNDRYSELRANHQLPMPRLGYTRIEMSYIGG
jgi:molybdenum cofactor biosynthesis enzyme MoaA